MKKSLETPILLIAFNRPDLTIQVMERIAEVRPGRIYFAVDAPRKSRRADYDKVAKVRKLQQMITWPCKVETLFQSENLGCKLGPYSAIKWFFENEEEGIILEDDVLAEPSFFYYCQELLEYYRDNQRVGLISGNNFYSDKFNNKSGYFFSRYSQTWGWASWRRVWDKYDLNMEKWPQLKNEKWLNKIFNNKKTAFYWKIVFDAVYSGEISSAWDYQWTFMSFYYNLLSIIPGVSLTKNIGIGVADATHTKSKNRFFDISTEPILLPLVHPKEVIANVDIDRSIQKNNYVLWKEIAARIVKRLRLKI